jgi:hypothetical protein
VRRFLGSENLFRGLRLALVATLATALHMGYEYLVVRRGYVEAHLGAASITPRFLLDMLGAFVVLFISATAGFAWASGRGLVGFGSWRRVRRDLTLIVPIGAALAVLTLLVLEPLLYKPLLAAKRNPFQPLFVSTFEEVICRWGIFAIAFRLSGRIWASVLTSTLFNVLLAVNGLVKLVEHVEEAVPAWQIAAIVAVKFALALGYALFFVRKGLLSTMALRFVAALPAPVLAAFG